MGDIAEKSENKKIVVAKNAAELQKIRLEKLMKNPAKPAFIPEHSKDYKPRDALEFIRNIWGSSAGAGSGDFHVYRGVRRREYARQKFAKEKTEKEAADDAYQQKMEENSKASETKTAKKRAKRLKKKQKQKNKKMKKSEETKTEDSSEEDDSEEDNEENTTNSISSGCDGSRETTDTEINGYNSSDRREHSSNVESNDNNNADKCTTKHKIKDVDR